jgi:hypothetical protein
MLIRKLLLCLMLGLMFSTTPDSECYCEEPVNIWFKISNDQSNLNYGQVIALDMSQGQSFTDGVFIYLVLSDANTNEEVILTFPIGQWVVEAKDEIQIEFDSLEEYLRSTKGSLIEKK